MADKKKNLEELPEFMTHNLFENKGEFPVYEIARLSHRQYHHVEKPYRLQEVVHVIGRSINQGSVRGKKEYTLFCAHQAITRLDGTTIAVNTSGVCIRTVNLDDYEILRSHDKLYRCANEREI